MKQQWEKMADLLGLTLCLTEIISWHYDGQEHSVLEVRRILTNVQNGLVSILDDKSTQRAQRTFHGMMIYDPESGRVLEPTVQAEQKPEPVPQTEFSL